MDTLAEENGAVGFDVPYFSRPMGQLFEPKIRRVNEYFTLSAVKVNRNASNLSLFKHTV